MRDDAVLRRALPLGRGLGRPVNTGRVMETGLYATMEIDGIIQRRCVRKIWCDGTREDVKRFGLSQEDAQDC